MPNRYARNRFMTLAAVVAGLASTAFAQELRFPSDGVAEAVAPPIPPNPTVANDINYQSLANAAALGPNEVPFTASGAGQVYNPTLGAHLRATYRTRSYAQQEGTFSLGTLKAINLKGGVAFLDGQVTLNDDSGVGYNVGAGYRWLTPAILPWGLDREKIAGLSIWSDGQTIDRESFFPQVGVSFELLGERFDLRGNAYIPVGSDTQDRDFVTTEGTFFAGDSLVNGQTLFTRDVALTSGDLELAGRLGNLDAWAFGGIYALDGEGVDAFGGKIGLRGYATPDLLVSIALSNDDEFDTNALFNLTWFIGRTRAENVPTGVLTDRFREPVIRNNYVATQQVAVAENNEALVSDLVHVDSTAAAGGDGTFENPLNSLDALAANSSENDTIIVHADSVFTGQTAALQNGQTFLGEGGGTALAIGTVTLPETTTGALSGALPTIDGGAASAITLANDNSVENFIVSGGTQAVDATGANNPAIDNVTVNAGAGGFLFSNVTGTATVANSSLTGTTTPAISITGGTGVVTVDSLTTINDVVGTAIDINGNQGEVTIDADVNTAAGVDGGGVVIAGNQATVTLNGAVTANNQTAFSVTDAEAAINTSGAITHNGTGDAVAIVDTAANDAVGITIGGLVTNSGGRSVFVDASNDTVSFNAAVNDTGTGIRIEDLASTGQVDFAAPVTANTGANAGDSVSLANNDANSIVSFGVLNITTTNGEGLVSDGGVVNVDGAGSSISTASDTAIRLTGGSSTQGVTFATVTADNVADDSAVVVTNFDGDVTINGGTIGTTGAFDAVTLTDAGLTLADVTIDSGSSTAINATFNSNTDARTLSATDVNLSGDGVNVVSSGTQDNTVGFLNVTGFGDTNLELQGSGNLDADLLSLEGPGQINATSSVASTGDLEVDVVGSGGTTALGQIVIVDQGDGALTTFVSGTQTTGDLSVISAGGGDASVMISNVAAAGTITATATNTGNFSADIDGGAQFDTTQLRLDAGNTGEVTYTLNGLAFDTGGATNAIELALGAGVTTANVTVADNTGVQTGAGRALDVDIASNGTVNFLLDNNTFTNNLSGAASQTAFVNVSAGTGTSNVTVTGNTFNNSFGLGGDEFEVVNNAAGATLNLNISGNTANSDPAGVAGNTGNGVLNVTENAGTFNVFELADTVANTDDRNSPGVTFNPNDGAFDNAVTAPDTP